MRAKILVVDDQRLTCEQLKMILEKEGHQVHTASDGREALEQLAEGVFSLVITDLKMPGMGGMELLKQLKRQYPEVSSVVMTAKGSIDTAVEAMKLGANDYLTKPFGAEEISLVTAKALERRKLYDEVLYLRQQLAGQYKFDSIISKSPKMHRVFELIASVALTDSIVLIQGETGTGKELVARAIHYHSSRREGRLVAINCGALPDSLLESELFGHTKGAFTGAIRDHRGKFEQAHGGTLFLDEIGNISPAMQVKLLRVLERMEVERIGDSRTIQVDVRILCATNTNLEEEMEKGNFRADLFYRINVVPILLPPLRERMEDIPLLVTHFLARYSKMVKKNVKEISPEVLSALLNYHWPGNVRQLENFIERGVIMARSHTLTQIDLPKKSLNFVFQEKEPSLAELELPLEELKHKVTDRLERDYLRKMLTRYQGSIKLSSKHAGLSARSLYAKMKQYGLNKEDFKRR